MTRRVLVIGSWEHHHCKQQFLLKRYFLKIWTDWPPYSRNVSYQSLESVCRDFVNSLVEESWSSVCINLIAKSGRIGWGNEYSSRKLNVSISCGEWCTIPVIETSNNVVCPRAITCWWGMEEYKMANMDRSTHRSSRSTGYIKMKSFFVSNLFVICYNLNNSLTISYSTRMIFSAR